MESLTPMEWKKLFDAAEHAAWHLEMRDSYAVEEEAADIRAWYAGTWTLEADARSKAWWLDLMRRTRARGVDLRRARIVSQDPTDYIRFEHFGTPNNIEAGEQVRWLWRTAASTMALPGNDFWVFDGRVVVFNHFTGDGGWQGNSSYEDETALFCAVAFEQVWRVATAHKDFELS